MSQYYTISAALILLTTTIAFAFNNPSAQQVSTPSSCPFVSESGLDCIGLVGIGTPVLAGTKYTCSNGHTWIEKN